MVVGRGQRHDLADREPGQRLGRGALVLGRVVHRADADDRALALHQARHRVDGADRARVGEADRGAGEVVGGELVAARPAHDVLVGRPERGRSPSSSAALIAGTSSCRVPSGFWTSMARPRLTCSGWATAGLPSTSVKPAFISGMAASASHDREADQVGERDLAAAAALEVVVDDDAVVDEQLGRDRAHAGGGRDLRLASMLVTTRAAGPLSRTGSGCAVAALLGRLGGGGVGRLGRRGLARPARRRLLGGGLAPARPSPARACPRAVVSAPAAGRRPGSPGRGRPARAVRGSGSPRPPSGATPRRWPAGWTGRRPVVLEEVPPGPVDGVRVLEVLLVDLVDEPLVGAEAGMRPAALAR